MKRRFRPAESRGQSLVEFALILPIFILVLVGIFDGGRLVFAYHTVNNAAREGGREATVNQTITDIQARAAEHAVALGIDPTTVSVDFRLPTGAGPNTPGSCNSAVGTPQIYGCLAVVQVTYDYVPAIPLMATVMGRNVVTVTGEVRFPVEFNCVDNLAINLDCPLGN